MDSTMIAAMSAIAGSIVGATGTFLGSLVTQRSHDRRDLLASQIARRETLYSDFISESARLLLDALEHDVVVPANLVPVYALLSRIRLCSPPEVLTAAEDIVKNIIETYAKPNLSGVEIGKEKLSGVDPLRTFSEICRNDLDRVVSKF
jgi:hypothetical protein